MLPRDEFWIGFFLLCNDMLGSHLVHAICSVCFNERK